MCSSVMAFENTKTGWQDYSDNQTSLSTGSWVGNTFVSSTGKTYTKVGNSIYGSDGSSYLKFNHNNIIENTNGGKSYQVINNDLIKPLF